MRAGRREVLTGRKDRTDSIFLSWMELWPRTRSDWAVLGVGFLFFAVLMGLDFLFITWSMT